MNCGTHTGQDGARRLERVRHGDESLGLGGVGARRRRRTQERKRLTRLLLQPQDTGRTVCHEGGLSRKKKEERTAERESWAGGNRARPRVFHREPKERIGKGRRRGCASDLRARAGASLARARAATGGRRAGRRWHEERRGVRAVTLAAVGAGYTCMLQAAVGGGLQRGTDGRACFPFGGRRGARPSPASALKRARRRDQGGARAVPGAVLCELPVRAAPSNACSRPTPDCHVVDVVPAARRPARLRCSSAGAFAAAAGPLCVPPPQPSTLHAARRARPASVPLRRPRCAPGPRTPLWRPPAAACFMRQV